MCAWIGGDEDMTWGIDFVCVCVRRKERQNEGCVDSGGGGCDSLSGTPIRNWYPRFI